MIAPPAMPPALRQFVQRADSTRSTKLAKIDCVSRARLRWPHQEKRLAYDLNFPVSYSSPAEG
jgi:hypothetical protein